MREARFDEDIRRAFIGHTTGPSHDKNDGENLCRSQELLIEAIQKVDRSWLPQKVLNKIKSCTRRQSRLVKKASSEVLPACLNRTPVYEGKRAKSERAKAARDRLREMVVGRSINLRRITTDR